MLLPPGPPHGSAMLLPARHRDAPSAAPARLVAALIAALLMPLLISSLTSSLAPAAAAPAREATAPTDYSTWSEVAGAVGAKIDSALADYSSGNTTGAAADFQSALSFDYVASNIGEVISARIGQDAAAEHQSAFATLKKDALVKGNDDSLAAGSAALKASIAQAATTLDAMSDLAGPRDYAAAKTATIQAQREQIQASKKQVNSGRGERSWAEVAQEMSALIQEGVSKARAGDGEGGAERVNKAYYGYYEKLGFEKTVLTAISGDRVSKVEHQFKVVRKTMLAGEDPSAAAAELTSMIREDAAALDGGAAASVNPVKAFFTSSFGQALLILLREGLEAILVVAAIIAYLLKAGMKDRVKHIYAGIVLALIASGIVAVLFNLLYDSASSHQEILEGVVALVAMLMLLGTSNWMLSKSSVASWNAYIKDRTRASVSNGGFWALAMLSFLAVFREGAETVLFYQALFAIDPSGSASIWQGFAVGAAILVVVFLLIRYTSVRIPLRPFFAITSALMAVLVVVFAGGGVHALIEGDVVPATYLPGWPTHDFLGLYPYRETLAAQAVMGGVVIGLAVASVIKRRREDRARVAAEGADGDETASTP
ncbi:FTR1 family iron permease [Actinomyces sp. zg296]|uniref:FTR1 family iron permease n=1 Tax=Actinomyces sp. zg296 TaxID=2609289 RepID=UPI001F31A685|nr:FTR1 family protein [Actinomyces sp. zg296]